MSDTDTRAGGYEQQLEEALGASERRYRELFEEDTAGRFVVTPDGRIFDGNPALARVLGFDRVDQLYGRQLQDFFQDRTRWAALVAQVGQRGRVDSAELALTRVDGDPISVVLWLTGTFGAEGDLLAVRGRLFDVTEFEHLKVRLLGARRMEAVGRLTGGIAHEFNNLLSIIDGHADRMTDALAEGHPLASSVATIQKAVRRAASLTKQMLAFGRRQVFQWRVVSLGPLLLGMRGALERLFGDAVELQFQIAADVPDVRIDPTQFEEVIVNLALNAREAMPAGGRFGLAVDAVEIGEAGEERPWVVPGRHARLRVSDTGVGMDAATKARAFEPFFTTKGIGDGVGLGLATVYGIVKQSGGYIWIESEQGHGTTLTLLFPAIPAVSAPAPSPDADRR